MEEANRFLREKYIAEFNRRFTVPVAQRGHAFVPVRVQDLEGIFSIQHERVVGGDNIVKLGERIMQIEKTPWRGTLAGVPGAHRRTPGWPGDDRLRASPGGPVHGPGGTPVGPGRGLARRATPALGASLQSPYGLLRLAPKLQEHKSMEADRSCANNTNGLNMPGRHN